MTDLRVEALLTPERVEAAARALWKMGNARIGERPWGAVAAHYIAEATVALEAALAGAPPLSPEPRSIDALTDDDLYPIVMAACDPVKPANRYGEVRAALKRVFGAAPALSRGAPENEAILEAAEHVYRLAMGWPGAMPKGMPEAVEALYEVCGRPSPQRIAGAPIRDRDYPMSALSRGPGPMEGK